MDIHRPALAIAILAVLLAAAARASSDAVGITPGDVQLAISPDTVSTLPIDTQGLAETACRGTSGSPNVPGCRMALDPGGHWYHLISPWNRNLSWQPRETSFASTPVDSSCGTWDVSLQLGDADSQPASPLLVTPGPDDPGHGTFSGSLEMKGTVHLANRNTGKTADYPLSFGFELSGPWALTDPDPSETSDGAPVSNLDLLSDGATYCVSPWATTNDPELAKHLARNCRMCLRRVP